MEREMMGRETQREAGKGNDSPAEGAGPAALSPVARRKHHLRETVEKRR